MTHPPAEIISGPKVGVLIQQLIDSRRFCKIRIPDTPFCWITLLSGVGRERGGQYLLVDGVPGFEPAFSSSKGQEIILEYSDPGGIHCYFTARVAGIFPKAVRVDFPEVVYRIQRRTFYRLKAEGGTEVVVRLGPEKEERGKVRDYSLGGLAFFTDKDLALSVGDQLRDLCLKIPEGGGWFLVSIPRAAVRRADRADPPNRFLYALEFLEMGAVIRKNLARHIFEKQREVLRRFGKSASFGPSA